MYIDDDYYQGISNISITVFVDDDVEPKSKIEISEKEFFTNKYAVDTKNKKLDVDDYKKTFMFNLRDYEINNIIKFVVSYDWTYQENVTYFSKELIFYGNFINDKFIINKEMSLFRT